MKLNCILNFEDISNNVLGLYDCLPLHWSINSHSYASKVFSVIPAHSHRHLCRSQCSSTLLSIHALYLRNFQLLRSCTALVFHSVQSPPGRPPSIHSTLYLRLVHYFSQHQLSTSLPHSSIYPSWSLCTYSTNTSFS